MKETKARTPEYLSKDILDKEFVNTFRFVHGMQLFLGSCRIVVKDQFVTSPTRYQKFHTVFCIFIALSLNIALLDYYMQILRDAALQYLRATSTWVAFGIFVCVITNTRFCNGQGNADFFIQMQKVDRIMGLDKIKEINLILKKVNNTSLSLILGTFISIFILLSFNENMYMNMTMAGLAFGQLTSTIEIVYCSNLIIYFVIRLRFMNAIIRNHLKQNTINKAPVTFNFLSNRNLRKLAVQTHDFVTSDTHVYLKELLDLFAMFQNLYRFQLFIFCLKLILGSLCAFGMILFSIQKNVTDALEVSSMFLFTIVDIFAAIFLGFRLQIFFEDVKETKRLSIAVMAEYSSGPLREKARKMLKMAEETPPRLSIYDMYDMDAGIFLTLFSLITSLIVTLLQFAFL